MAIDEITERVRQGFFQSRILEARNLIPTNEIISIIDEVSRPVAYFLENDPPETVITLGRSGILSRILLDRGLRGKKRNFPMVRMDGKVNQLLYKASYPEEITEEQRIQRLTQLFSNEYSALPRTKKIVVVDEFIQSGVKAVEVLSRFHALGFRNISWACFTAEKDVDFTSEEYLEKLYKENERFPTFIDTFEKVRSGEAGVDLKRDVFIGSYNQTAHEYLKKLANLISVTKVSLYDDPKEIIDDSIKDQLAKDLSNVLRGIATAQTTS